MAHFLQLVTFLLCLPFILSQDRIITDLDDLPFSGWTAKVNSNVTDAQVGQCAGHNYIVLNPKAQTCKNYTLSGVYSQYAVKFDIFTESDFFSYIKVYINGQLVDLLEYLELWTGEPLTCQLKIDFYQTLKTININATVPTRGKSFNICFERGDKQYGTSIIGFTKMRAFGLGTPIGGTGQQTQDPAPSPVPVEVAESGGGGGGAGAVIGIAIGIAAVIIVIVTCIIIHKKKKKKRRQLQLKQREQQTFPYAPKDIVLLGYDDNPPMGGSGVKPGEAGGGLPILPAPIPMMESNGHMSSSQGSQGSSNNLTRSLGREELGLISPTVPQEGSKTLKHIVQRAKL